MTMASKIIAVAKVLLGGNYCLFTKEVYSPLPIGLLLPVANAFALDFDFDLALGFFVNLRFFRPAIFSRQKCLI